MLQLNSTTTVEEARMILEKVSPSERKRLLDTIPSLSDVASTCRKMDTLRYNYTRLFLRIWECGYSLPNFACEINLTEPGLFCKLSSHACFGADEIEHVRVLLNIPGTEVGAYFFENTA